MIAKLKPGRRITGRRSAEVHQRIKADVHIGRPGASERDRLRRRPRLVRWGTWERDGGRGVGGARLIRCRRLLRLLLLQQQRFKLFLQRLDLLAPLLLLLLKLLLQFLQLLFQLLHIVRLLGRQRQRAEAKRRGQSQNFSQFHGFSGMGANDERSCKGSRQTKKRTDYVSGEAGRRGAAW